MNISCPLHPDNLCFSMDGDVFRCKHCQFEYWQNGDYCFTFNEYFINYYNNQCIDPYLYIKDEFINKKVIITGHFPIEYFSGYIEDIATKIQTLLIFS